MSEEVRIPEQFTHSIKISETAKGIRIDVHVYANSQTEAINQAFEMYEGARARAVQGNIALAPVEVSK
jgi:hypothetical protein